MKVTVIFISLITFVLQIGCKQFTEPIASDMYVSFDVESVFNNDSVRLTLDNDTLLNSKVTTNDVISLAWSSGLQKLSRENHSLHFAVVAYEVQKDYKVDTSNDTSTVLLRFNKDTKEISIRQLKGISLRY